ncbi:MAG: hypothetical protein MI723_04940, partial [Caulobacterales bacterium]|nr:hypothetical protein [Caulobacterales bacterium]
MSLIDKPPTRPLDMEGEGIAAAHIADIDMTRRAPELAAEQRARLPEPVIDGEPDLIALYWRSWAIAFDKVKPGRPEAGVADHVDAAFSNHLFQWDSCFMIEFLRYAAHVLPVYGTLDNYYAKQHANGFICREINGLTGQDYWTEDHPSAINPPLFADAEWRLHQITADDGRLARVLPALIGYFDWMAANRRAKDGTGYWTTALASGMDNTPRVFELGGGHAHKHYDHVWLCLTSQQALAARRIAEIAEVVGDAQAARRFEAEGRRLHDYIEQRMWNDAIGLYVDVGPKGELTGAKTPAACWPLLLGQARPERAAAVAANMTDPATFFRTHAIPSVSADNAVYHPRGNYWHGSVWPPMVHLVSRALRETGHGQAARKIAANHLANVYAVLQSTGTLWEDYAPESVEPGNIARPEFAGWTACGPVSGLIETII